MADYTGSDRRLAYLFANGGGGGGSCKVISGYYHDGSFYEDQSYTQIITGDTECLYIDLDTTTLYLFDGTDYVEVQGGGGGTGGLAVTEEVLQATEITITQWANPLSIPLTLADYVGFGVEITWESGSSPVSYFVTEEQINGNPYILIPQRYNSNTHNPVYIGYSNGNLNFYVVTNQSVTIHRVTGLKKANKHTYSTTEQVVGTWIDGKPIYEVSFSEVITNMTSDSQYQILDLTASAIENVIKIDGGYWYETNTATDKRYVAQGKYCSLEYAENGCILYGRQSFTSTTSNRKYTWIGTIQYTKTTD